MNLCQHAKPAHCAMKKRGILTIAKAHTRFGVCDRPMKANPLHPAFDAPLAVWELCEHLGRHRRRSIYAEPSKCLHAIGRVGHVGQRMIIAGALDFPVHDDGIIGGLSTTSAAIGAIELVLRR